MLAHPFHFCLWRLLRFGPDATSVFVVRRRTTCATSPTHGLTNLFSLAHFRAHSLTFHAHERHAQAHLPSRTGQISSFLPIFRCELTKSLPFLLILHAQDAEYVLDLAPGLRIDGKMVEVTYGNSNSVANHKYWDPALKFDRYVCVCFCVSGSTLQPQDIYIYTIYIVSMYVWRTKVIDRAMTARHTGARLWSRSFVCVC